MAERDRFSDQEWQTLSSAPLAATAAVVALNHSGLMAMFKELRAAGKAAKRAGKETGWPPVITEMMGTLDDLGSSSGSSSDDSADYDSTYQDEMEALSAAGRAATKLNSDELDAYVKWVLGLGSAAAEAVAEKGSSSPISDAERDALAEMERLLRST